MPPHPLINFQIQKYCQNELTLNGVYSRNNVSVLPTHIAQIKDQAYVINFDEYKLIKTYWIVLCVNDDNVTYDNTF